MPMDHLYTKKIIISTNVDISVHLTNLTIYQFNLFKVPGHVFHTNNIAYCQQIGMHSLLYILTYSL